MVKFYVVFASTLLIIFNRVAAVSCAAIENGDSRWHSITITSLPSYPLPLFRLHPIVNWQAMSAAAPLASVQCNLSSSFIHVNPSSPCGATIPLTLHLASSSIPASNADLFITPSCAQPASSNVSIACDLGNQQQIFASSRCGQPAVITGVSGRRVTCNALQHVWSGGAIAFSSTAAVSFLIPSPPRDVNLDCIRLLHATFTWSPPASPPPHYIAVLLSRGSVIGLQQITPSYPFELASVKWLLPATTPFAASCVASVYRSDVCVTSYSRASGVDGNFSETDYVFTSCPDMPRIDLSVIDLSQPSQDGYSDTGEHACYSQWICACVDVNVAAPVARSLVTNGTHGAVSLAQSVPHQGVGETLVSVAVRQHTLCFHALNIISLQVSLRAVRSRLPFFKAKTGSFCHSVLVLAMIG